MLNAELLARAMFILGEIYADLEWYERIKDETELADSCLIGNALRWKPKIKALVDELKSEETEDA